jgi:hypothetical protein
MSTEVPPAMPDVLERVMGDPAALVERIVRQVLEQLASRGDIPLSGEGAPEEMLATALGNRLAAMIAEEPQSSGPVPDELAQYARLLDRSDALAAALGACECWGEDPGCRVCDGAGSPGWLLPDARLFARYVRPAVRAIAGRPAPVDTVRSARKERADARFATG